MESIKECISYVNINGGFTIVGWYKRGVINNKTLVAGAGNTSHHKNDDNVQIGGSPLYIELNERKFNVNEIEEPNDK